MPLAADIWPIAVRSSRPPMMPARSSNGTVRDATRAVEAPRLPIAFSAGDCRSLPALIHHSAKDWGVSLFCTCSGSNCVPTRDNTRDAMDRCRSTLSAPMGFENRNPVWTVPVRRTI